MINEISTDSRPSTAAKVLFVVAAIILPCAICGGQLFTWFLEQYAIASVSAANLAQAGKVGLIAQGLVLIVTSGSLFALSHNTLRPIYQGWLLASVFTFPAIVLRFVGPNQDQIGSLLQIALAVVATGIAFSMQRNSLQFNPRRAIAAAAVVPLTIWPFLLWGALGSGADAILNFVAGLSFGALAAVLISTTADNYLLNGLGVAVLLSILGSAFGYDGDQLLLLSILPAFAFAVAALSPSAAASAVGIGLLTAFALMFFDPTEFALILGDNEIAGWATSAASASIVAGLVTGLITWLVGQWRSRPQALFMPAAVAAVTWLGAGFVFFAFGQPGFYGDRIFVVLKDQADVSSAYGIKDRTERLTFVYHTLVDHANQTQADLRQSLDRLGIRYKPYYLVNALEVQGGTLTRLYLSTRPEVDHIIDSPKLRPLPQPIPSSSGPDHAVVQSPGWNIKFIGADKVWNEFGVTGQGIVVGNSDTGVQGDHPALRDSYRGLESGDDYNWYDPWEGTTSPNDRQGHGTHTTGTVLGSGGIGVAPGAQWIACVNLDRNLGNPALYLDCLQFMLAPFPQHGDPFTDGDPAKAPHVLNNSWGCPPIEGCDPNALKPAADALRAAGIFVVVSAGNDGPDCGTVNAPLALYDSVFSVAAVDSGGNLAFFSSRGPVTVDGSDRMKPDIAAPGVSVFSAMPENTYGENDGTSMAGPHVVGVVALLWSANPELIGDIDRTEQILRETARPYSGGNSEQGSCDDLPLPNNGVGYGIVDAYAAVRRALGK